MKSDVVDQVRSEDENSTPEKVRQIFQLRPKVNEMSRNLMRMLTDIGKAAPDHLVTLGANWQFARVVPLTWTEGTQFLTARKGSSVNVAQAGSTIHVKASKYLLFEHSTIIRFSLGFALSAR